MTIALAVTTSRDGRGRAGGVVAFSSTHHVPLVLASAMGLVLFIALSPSLGGISISQFVVATGYVAVVFLGLTLLMGPSTPLRLDVDGSRPDSAGGAGGWPGRILQRGGVDAIEQGDEFWSTAAAKSG